MLEDLNSVLNNGDVPNIYKADEMEKIFHSMRGHVQEAGLQINRSNLFSVYVKTVRNNLHVVVTMRYFFFFFLSNETVRFDEFDENWTYRETKVS